MNRLKDLREDRDLKQEEVGRSVGVSKQSISQYERELRALTPDLIQKFCDYFDVTADYLLGRSPVQHPIMSNSDHFFLMKYREAPDTIKKAIRVLLEIDEDIDQK